MTNSSESIAWSNCAALTQPAQVLRRTWAALAWAWRARRRRSRGGAHPRSRANPRCYAAPRSRHRGAEPGEAAARKALPSRREVFLRVRRPRSRGRSDGRLRAERARACPRVIRRAAAFEKGVAELDDFWKTRPRVGTDRHDPSSARRPKARGDSDEWHRGTSGLYASSSTSHASSITPRFPPLARASRPVRYTCSPRLSPPLSPHAAHERRASRSPPTSRRIAVSGCEKPGRAPRAAARAAATPSPKSSVARVASPRWTQPLVSARASMRWMTSSVAPRWRRRRAFSAPLADRRA